jgi:hypothetical protein
MNIVSPMGTRILATISAALTALNILICVEWSPTARRLLDLLFPAG